MHRRKDNPLKGIHLALPKNQLIFAHGLVKLSFLTAVAWNTVSGTMCEKTKSGNVDRNSSGQLALCSVTHKYFLPVCHLSLTLLTTEAPERKRSDPDFKITMQTKNRKHSIFRIFYIKYLNIL